MRRMITVKMAMQATRMERIWAAPVSNGKHMQRRVLNSFGRCRHQSFGRQRSLKEAPSLISKSVAMDLGQYLRRLSDANPSTLGQGSHICVYI